MLERKLVKTADGSHSLYIPEWNEHYHSVHGAIQEAYHVFIKNGLDYFSKNSLSILEIGFGTGLNTLITLLESENKNLTIHYTAIEAFPITQSEFEELNYCEFLKHQNCQMVFQKIFDAEWNTSVEINPNFSLLKKQLKFNEIEDFELYDLIYFDAFGPRVQPELWTEVIFEKMYQSLKKEGVLVTYSAKGSVRRAMQASGFTIEKLPGPPGKREMLRGLKGFNVEKTSQL